MEFELLRMCKGKSYTKTQHWYLWMCSDETVYRHITEFTTLIFLELKHVIIMKNEGWSRCTKKHAGGADKLQIEFA